MITRSTAMRMAAITDCRQCFLRRMRSYTLDAPGGLRTRDGGTASDLQREWLPAARHGLGATAGAGVSTRGKDLHLKTAAFADVDFARLHFLTKAHCCSPLLGQRTAGSHQTMSAASVS